MKSTLSFLKYAGVFVLLILLLLSTLTLFCTKKLSNVADECQSKNEIYETFLREHFLNPITQEEMEVLYNLSKEDTSKILMFCPVGACSSCVVETLQTLSDERYGKDSVSVYFESGDYRMINESKMRGFHNAHMVTIPNSQSMVSILIRKIDRVGIYYYLKLPSSNRYVLHLFLNYSIVD